MSGSPQAENRTRSGRVPDKVWVGFTLGGVLNLLALGFFLLWGGSDYTGVLLGGVIGLTQILWVLPLLIFLGWRAQIQKGLVIAATVTFLLNVTCIGGMTLLAPVIFR